MSIVETIIPAPTRFFRSYNEIPPEIRRYILDESGERRVKRVTLEKCSEYAREFYELKEQESRLRDFELHVQRDGCPLEVKKYQDFQSVIVAFDREIGYNIGSRGVTMVITQAGRPIKGYMNGRVIERRTSIYDGVSSGEFYGNYG